MIQRRIDARHIFNFSYFEKESKSNDGDEGTCSDGGCACSPAASYITLSYVTKQEVSYQKTLLITRSRCHIKTTSMLMHIQPSSSSRFANLVPHRLALLPVLSPRWERIVLLEIIVPILQSSTTRIRNHTRAAAHLIQLDGGKNKKKIVETNAENDLKRKAPPPPSHSS